MKEYYFMHLYVVRLFLMKLSKIVQTQSIGNFFAIACIKPILFFLGWTLLSLKVEHLYLYFEFYYLLRYHQQQYKSHLFWESLLLLHLKYFLKAFHHPLLKHFIKCFDLFNIVTDIIVYRNDWLLQLHHSPSN